MDTDIRNYSYDEILDVLHIEHDDLTKELLKNKIAASIQKLSKSGSLNEEQKNEYVHFFNSCFHEVCRYNNFNYEITEPAEYIGALPKREPNTVAINTYASKYAKGDLNPIQRETIKHTLVIGSKNGSSDISTDFSVTLSEPMSNVVSLKASGIEIVNFFYNISTYLKNNTFAIISYLRNVTTGEKTNLYRKNFTLSDGYYNIANFTALIEPIIEADVQISMIEFVYDSLKGKLFFALKDTPPTPPPAGFEYEFELDFLSNAQNKEQTVGFYMGYNKSYYTFEKDYNQIKTASTEIGYIPEMCTDFTGSKFFLLEVIDFNNNAPQVLLINNYNKSSDILAKIPNKSPMTTVIFEDSSDRIFKTRKYFGPVKIQKLRIRLLDQYGKLVDLNGCDLCVTLELESLDIPYKKLIH